MPDTHDIKQIDFGILSSEDIRKMGVCLVDSTELTGSGTVYDPKMGYIPESDDDCPTCGQRKDCPGHFGYIRLNEPVLHPMLYKTIASFLKCICKKCHRVLLTKDQLELQGFLGLKYEKRFQKIVKKVSKIDICSHDECRAPQPQIVYKSKDMTISMEYKQKKQRDPDAEENDEKKSARKKETKIDIIMSVEDIKKIFDNIKDEEVELLGFDPKKIHPRNLIFTLFPVIPPCSRPYIIAEGNICDDDLTYQLLEIIKINNQLKDSPDGKEMPEQKKQRLVQALKFRIQTMFDNSKSRAKHPTDSRPLKGIKERLGGKTGRIRGNIMGKRVDFSARTVIGADPTLKLNQVGIPYEVAKIHTKPEVVTEHNIEWLTKLVNNGQANYITTDKDGENMGKNKLAKRIRKNLQYAMYRGGTKLLAGDIIVKGEGKLEEDKEGKIVTESKKPKGNLVFVPVVTGYENISPKDRLIRNGKLFPVVFPEKRHITLKIGDIVERHLQKGDIVLLNRQPTLHRGSMLAVEVVPGPHKSFRFGLAQTKSFNADFDLSVDFKKQKSETGSLKRVLLPSEIVVNTDF